MISQFAAHLGFKQSRRTALLKHTPSSFPVLIFIFFDLDVHGTSLPDNPRATIGLIRTQQQSINPLMRERMRGSLPAPK
jgi:hypothetical protein